MASRSPGKEESSRITVYDLKVKKQLLSDFKRLILENLHGSTFMNDTPIRIRRNHQLVGIDGVDVRQLDHTTIQAKLRKGLINKTFVLKIAIPSGPCFSNVKTSGAVSSKQLYQFKKVTYIELCFF